MQVREKVEKSRFTVFYVQMSFRAAGDRDSVHCQSQKWAKREGFVAASNTTTTKLCNIPLHYATLQLQLQLHIQLQLHYITLRYTNCITLHYTTLRYATLH